MGNSNSKTNDSESESNNSESKSNDSESKSNDSKPPKNNNMSTNYYKYLNIDQNADRDTIKKACREMRFKYHPDTRAKDINVIDADEMIKKLNDACAILLDK